MVKPSSQLAVEIWEQIALYQKESDVLTIMLLSKYFKEIGERVLYRDVRIDWVGYQHKSQDHCTSEQFLKRIVAMPSLGAHVRKLFLRWIPSNQVMIHPATTADVDAILKTINDLIEAGLAVMTGLVRLTVHVQDLSRLNFGAITSCSLRHLVTGSEPNASFIDLLERQPDLEHLCLENCKPDVLKRLGAVPPGSLAKLNSLACYNLAIARALVPGRPVRRFEWHDFSLPKDIAKAGQSFNFLKNAPILEMELYLSKPDKLPRLLAAAQVVSKSLEKLDLVSCDGNMLPFAKTLKPNLKALASYTKLRKLTCWFSELGEKLSDVLAFTQTSLARTLPNLERVNVQNYQWSQEFPTGTDIELIKENGIWRGSMNALKQQ